MRLWLDDIRPAPRGWVHAHSAAEAIAWLARGDVEEMSLDHDLGEELTGYDVLCWIEKAIAMDAWDGFCLPKFWLHSSNPVGLQNMERCIVSIQNQYKKFTEGN